MAVTTGVDVAARLAEVRARIAAACAKCGRDPQQIELVAVSKFHAPEAIRAAYAVGQRQFGESYAQELVSKAEALKDLPDLRFRFIGGLQTNKAKALVQARCTVDSLASEDAARALSNKAVAARARVEVLIQVNVAGEAQKRGVGLADLDALVSAVRALPALDLLGLMTIPPADDDVEARRCFRILRERADALGLPTRSMGMSDDLEIAIEEGSTMLRIGTAIFGPREA